MQRNFNKEIEEYKASDEYKQKVNESIAMHKKLGIYHFNQGDTKKNIRKFKRRARAAPSMNASVLNFLVNEVNGDSTSSLYIDPSVKNNDILDNNNPSSTTITQQESPTILKPHVYKRFEGRRGADLHRYYQMSQIRTMKAFKLLESLKDPQIDATEPSPCALTFTPELSYITAGWGQSYVFSYSNSRNRMDFYSSFDQMICQVKYIQNGTRCLAGGLDKKVHIIDHSIIHEKDGELQDAYDEQYGGDSDVVPEPRKLSELTRLESSKSYSGESNVMDWVRSIELNKSEKTMAVGCYNTSLSIVDVNTFSTIFAKVFDFNTTKGLHDRPLNTINTIGWMNQDENILAVGYKDGHIRGFDIRCPEEPIFDHFAHNIKETFEPSKLNNLEFTDDDRFLISSGRDSRICIWDIRHLSKHTPFDTPPIRTFNHHSSINYHTKFCTYLDRFIVTGSESKGCIFIYDRFDENVCYRVKGPHQDIVYLVESFGDVFFSASIESDCIGMWGPTHNPFTPTNLTLLDDAYLKQKLASDILFNEHGNDMIEVYHDQHERYNTNWNEYVIDPRDPNTEVIMNFMREVRAMNDFHQDEELAEQQEVMLRLYENIQRMQQYREEHPELFNDDDSDSDEFE